MQSGRPNLTAPARRSAPGGAPAASDLVFAQRQEGAAAETALHRRSRWVFAVNGIAAVAITAAVAFRLAQAGMPSEVLKEELAVLGVGIAYAAGVVWFRTSPALSRTGVQLLLMAANVLLADIALGVAGAVVVVAFVVWSKRKEDELLEKANREIHGSVAEELGEEDAAA